MFKRGPGRIQAILGRIDSIAKELALGVAEIDEAIEANQKKVLELKAQNDALGTSKMQGITLLANLNKLTEG